MSARRRTLGRYTLLKAIGRGGMGVIYLGARRRAGGFSRPVAIKTVLRGHGYEFSQRFREEGALLLSMHHPHVVDVFEMARTGSEFFLVMEYVEGRDLGNVLLASLRRGRLPSLAAALYITRCVLSGLSYCHSHTDESGRHLGLIHRDISPGNILISHRGELKLADFGLAHSTRKLSHTRPQIVLGKLGYMAPERLVGPDVDQRADLFSVGVVLFELLTGRRFAPAQKPDAYLQEVEQRSHSAEGALGYRLPGAVVRLAKRSMAADPAMRYGSAREFYRAVDAVHASVCPNYGAPQLAAELMAPNFQRQAERSALVTLMRDALIEEDPNGLPTTEWVLPSGLRRVPGGAAQSTPPRGMPPVFPRGMPPVPPRQVQLASAVGQMSRAEPAGAAQSFAATPEGR